MGTGKGSPHIWVYRPNLNKPFAIFTTLHYIRMHQVIVYLKKYLHKYIFVKYKSKWLF